MRILAVEDDPRLRESLAGALREAGYAVDAAEDGEEGWYKASSWDYDAILLDVSLPGLDGWEILRRLRAEKTTPVLMLTARDAPRDRIRGLDGGADDYLTKPFDLHELLARVRALIRRAAGQASSVVEVGSVAIDLRARSVRRDGAPVAVTAREFGILEYLALHRGEIVTRTALYDHLFDDQDGTLSNLIDVHIVSLRKKLGASLITTHRGQGYSIAQ